MQMHGLSGEISLSLSGKLQELKQKAAEFNIAQAVLERSRPDPVRYPAEFAKWNELRDYGYKTKSAIKWLLDAADTAGNVGSSLYYGLTHPFGYDIGLGILPLVPIAGVAITGAVIASALAALTYFITGAYEYKVFAEATPEVQAAIKAHESTTGAAGIAKIFTSVTGLVIVAGLIYIVPKLLNKGK